MPQGKDNMPRVTPSHLGHGHPPLCGVIFLAKDFYERRSIVAGKVEQYLQRCDQLAREGKPPLPVQEFVWSLVRDDGATDRMITEMFRRHGIKLEDNTMVRA